MRQYIFVICAFYINSQLNFTALWVTSRQVTRLLLYTPLSVILVCYKRLSQNSHWFDNIKDFVTTLIKEFRVYLVSYMMDG